MIVAAEAQADVGAYAILYLGVAASWIGIPIVGAGAPRRRWGSCERG